MAFMDMMLARRGHYGDEPPLNHNIEIDQHLIIIINGIGSKKFLYLVCFGSLFQAQFGNRLAEKRLSSSSHTNSGGGGGVGCGSCCNYVGSNDERITLRHTNQQQLPHVFKIKSLWQNDRLRDDYDDNKRRRDVDDYFTK